MNKLLLIFVFTLFLGGCTPNLGGRSDSNRDPKEFVKGALIGSFPPVPFHPDLQIIESYKDEDSYGASFVGSKSVDELIEYYQKGLPQTGWEGTLRKKTDTNYVISIKNSDFRGEIVINLADDGEQTAVSTFVSAR